MVGSRCFSSHLFGRPQGLCDCCQQLKSNSTPGGPQSQATGVARSIFPRCLALCARWPLEEHQDESGGQEFESLRARHYNQRLIRNIPVKTFPENALGKVGGRSRNPHHTARRLGRGCTFFRRPYYADASPQPGWPRSKFRTMPTFGKALRCCNAIERVDFHAYGAWNIAGDEVRVRPFPTCSALVRIEWCGRP